MENLIESPNNIISSISIPNEIGTEVVGNTYRTKDHWITTMYNNQNVWQCLHCQTKKYSINTSRTHLKEHTIKCPNSPLMDTQNDAFQQIIKEEIDKLIVDLIVRTGMSFNVLENPLFHKMARNLQYVKKSYKVPHPTTISRYIRSWVSDNWKIVNIILSFQQSGQTANEILSVIKNTLDEYSIKEKIFALTMDNTTTNKAVTNPLSSGRLEILESYCIILGIKFLRPVLEINTRWNSTLAMFERYLYLHSAISEMCLKDPSMPPCLDHESFLILESFCQFLKPFEKATLILSKEQSNSISNAIIIILEICQHINQIRNNDMIYKMKKKFEKYWDVIIEHVIIAYVLDLRYKLDHLKAILIQVGRYSKSDAELFVDNIQQKIISNGIKYSIAESSNIETVENNYFGTIEYELELYERVPLENFSNNNEKEENKGILIWESLSYRFPVLSRMAQDYLSIKLSSVSSER
ncbi:3129_t:CDS:2, partial [Scutellospora calospora]